MSEQRQSQNNAADSQKLLRQEEKPFFSARRHSRRVRFLKIFLPIAAVISAAVFTYFTFWKAPSRQPAVITLNGENQGNKLVMTAPKVNGFTKDGKPYALRASKAIQDPAKSGIIELQNISGTVPLSSKGAAQVEASSAFFDNVNGLLHFDKPFTVVTADGTQAHFKTADVNVQAGEMNTSDAVAINNLTQFLTATSMKVTDSGKVMHFGGRVHIVIIEKDKPQNNKVTGENSKAEAPSAQNDSQAEQAAAPEGQDNSADQDNAADGDKGGSQPALNTEQGTDNN